MARTLVVGIALAVMAGISLFAQTARDEVTKAEVAFDQARAKGDKAAYANLLADEFTWTTRTGATMSKQQQLATIRCGPSSGSQGACDCLEYADLSSDPALAEFSHTTRWRELARRSPECP